MINSNKQIKEIDEAIHTGNEVIVCADKALKLLNSAKGWATFDMFSDGGFLSGLFKYNKIDQANDVMNQLKYKLKAFTKELGDINQHINHSLNTYSTGLRAVDIFLDNIFTDFHVRGKIKDDIKNVENLKRTVFKMLWELKELKKSC